MFVHFQSIVDRIIIMICILKPFPKEMSVIIIIGNSTNIIIPIVVIVIVVVVVYDD